MGKLRQAGFVIDGSRYTYGIIETFTNNISYLITGADRRRKGLYAVVFPALLGQMSVVGPRPATRQPECPADRAETCPVPR